MTENTNESYLVNCLIQVRKSLDDLMKLDNKGYRLAVIENKLGEKVYLDSMSIYLDKAIEQATIAHQNQDAVPIYEVEIMGWVNTTKEHYEKHKGTKRIVYLAPPQPQDVNSAIEAAANICDERIKKIEIAINDEDDENEAITLKSLAWQFLVTASEIRALIK